MVAKRDEPVFLFGDFELDIKNRQLCKAGTVIKLQQQPFKVLSLLVQRAGQLVTRKEIHSEVWAGKTFVDFEQGLNYCIQRIRKALNDDARNPAYIETLPRLGYRFIAGVERLPRTSSIDKEVGLAVLPLNNLASDRTEDYLAEGMTDALITELARIRALHVISRTSAMRFKQTGKSIREIGRELNVDFVVEGSVVRGKERIRISARLVDVATDQHIWAKSYERQLSDILALQKKLASTLAKEIQVELTPVEQERLTANPRVRPRAYEIYLKGRSWLEKRTEESLKKSIEFFEQSILEDSESPLPYAGLAKAYLLLGVWGHLPEREAFAKAKEAANRALTIDAALAEAHAAMAWLKQSYDWDLVAAEREFRKAIELKPSYSVAHHWYALHLSAQVRHAEAMAQIEKARQLDPLSAVINTSVGTIFFYARQYDRAIKQVLKTLDFDPDFALAHWRLGTAYGQKHMYEEAIGELQRAVGLSRSSPRILATLGHTYAISGERSRAMRIIDELKKQAERRWVPVYEVAAIYAGLGETESVFKWLEKAYENRDSWLIFSKVDPRFDSVRCDQRFESLLRRVGLPP